MSELAAAMPTDTAIAVGALAAWQRDVIAAGEDGLAGMSVTELRASITEIGKVRREHCRVGTAGEEPLIQYGGWGKRRAFRALQGSEQHRSRLPAAQQLMFWPGHYSTESLPSGQRDPWAVKIVAGEAMLLAALDASAGTDAERRPMRHYGGCGESNVPPINDRARAEYERALDEIAKVEEAARRVRDIAMASLKTSRRQGAALRREIRPAAAGVATPLLLAWRASRPDWTGSAVRLLAANLAWAACCEMGWAGAGPLRLLGPKTATSVLCISAARSLVQAALSGNRDRARKAHGYCRCSALAPPYFEERIASVAS